MGISTNINTSKVSRTSYNNSSYNSNKSNNYNVNKNTTYNNNTYNNSYNNNTYNNSYNYNNNYSSNYNSPSTYNSNVKNDVNKYDKYNEYLEKATSASKTNINISTISYSTNHNVAKIDYSYKYMNNDGFNKLKPELMNLVGAKNPDSINNLADIVGLAYRNKKRRELINDVSEEKDFSFGSCVIDTCTNYLGGAKKLIKKGGKAIDKLADVTKKCNATGANAFLSVGEGVLKFGETLVDTAALSGTGIISIVTAPIDAVRGTDFTDYMYDNTKKFIAKKHVESVYDSFYEETKPGKWIKDNSYAYNTVRNVSSSIGYTIGVVLTAVFTGGTSLSADSVAMAAPTAETLGMTAFVGGVGKGSENAYSSGASTEKGATTALANGLWEGFQFYAGGKIAGISPFTKEGANIALRVGLDTVDGAAEGFVQPLISSIYQKGYYDPNLKKYIEFDENTSFLNKYKHIWDEQGGWKQVGTQAAVGLIMSTAGEAGNIRRAFNDRSVKLNSTLGNLNDRLGYWQTKNDLITYDRVSVEHFDRASQQEMINNINNIIRNGDNATLPCINTMDVTSYVLENVDDLSKLKVEIKGGFADQFGNYKGKYNQALYKDRVTYTGYEALEIIKRVETLEAKIDKNLPTVKKARQIYELIAEEYPYYGNEDFHRVSSSLRGMIPQNAAGREGLVCAGYAQLYKELCDRTGVNCEYVRGIGIVGSKREKHAWNVVIGDNGEKIPVDVTWKVDGEEYFGPSTKFMKEHIADADEMYRVYSSDLNNVQNLDYIVNAMDKAHGKGTGVQGLIGYVATGDPHRITSQGGARAILTEIPITDTLAYLDSMDRSVRINESVNYIKEELINKYGREQAMLQLDDFLKTGNKDLITRSGGARTIAASLTPEDIKFYNSGGTY